MFSDAAVQFWLMVKVLFGLFLLQTTKVIASILKIADLDWPVPDLSPLRRRQAKTTVQIPQSSPLKLLVDGTGIEFWI